MRASFKGVSRSMFGTFGAQIAAPSSARPKFTAGVPAQCPRPFLAEISLVGGVSGEP